MSRIFDTPQAAVRHWVEHIVIGWNLCPFARKEFVNERIRYAVTEARDEESLLYDLAAEIEHLNQNDHCETTLIVVPHFLENFEDYNDFLDLAEALLAQMDCDDTYQIASFHPQYQFDGTQPEDAENYTNRAPYPILHLLRERSMTLAVDNYPDTDRIPQANIERLNAMPAETLAKAFSPYSAHL